MAWNSTAQAYSGTCTVAVCPSNAAGLPCACSQGFSGTLTWSQGQQRYDGSCAGALTMFLVVVVLFNINCRLCFSSYLTLHSGVLPWRCDGHAVCLRAILPRLDGLGLGPAELHGHLQW